MGFADAFARPAWHPPLGAFRLLVGGAALLFSERVRSGHPVLVSRWEVFAPASRGPTTAGLLGTGLLDEHPEIVATVCAVAASCVVAGWFARAGALLLWVVVVSYCRYCYPITSPEDALLGAMLLCAAMVPLDSGPRVPSPRELEKRNRSRPGSCGTVGLALAFLAMFVVQQGQCEGAYWIAALVSLLLLLAALLGGLAGQHGSRSVLDLGFLGVLVLVVLQGALATAWVAGLSAPGVKALAWALGLGWRAKEGGAVVAETRDGSPVTASTLWPALPARHAVWSYLERRSRGGADGPDTLRVRAQLKQSLADKACRALSSSTGKVMDVRTDTTNSPLLSFQCDETRALLVPPRLSAKAARPGGSMEALVSQVARALTRHNLEPQLEAPLQAYAAVAEHAPETHLAELLRLARYRFHAREFSEAARLVDLVVERASPAQRASGGLTELQRRVSKGPEAW